MEISGSNSGAKPGVHPVFVPVLGNWSKKCREQMQKPHAETKMVNTNGNTIKVKHQKQQQT